MVFTGGMPKASYGDRHTVGLERGSTQLVLDFTSPVLALAPVKDAGGKAEALAVLCEEELVMVDLVSEGWPTFRLPYLYPVHASPITAAHHVSPPSFSFHSTFTFIDCFVPQVMKPSMGLVSGLRQASSGQAFGRSGAFSSRPWPITGGQASEAPSDTDLLVTGHEDGSVKVWAMGGAGMELLVSVQTASLFADYVNPHARSEDEEEWPPFKKVRLPSFADSGLGQE